VVWVEERNGVPVLGVLYGELLGFWLLYPCLRLVWIRRMVMIVLPSAEGFAFAMQ
jgi:hypothetical protein